MPKKKHPKTKAAAKFSKELTFAPNDGVAAHGHLAYAMVKRLFNINALFISDQSCLLEFTNEPLNSIYDRIKKEYDVSCYDITDGNVVKVCQRVSRGLLPKRT